LRLSDAKKILSGELVLCNTTQYVAMQPKGKPDDWDYLTITKKDIQFMLRQLSLKVEREHKKASK